MLELKNKAKRMSFKRKKDNFNNKMGYSCLEYISECSWLAKLSVKPINLVKNAS